VVILFSPSGSVDSIYCWQGLNAAQASGVTYVSAAAVAGSTGAAPANAIYLLLGLQTQLQSPFNQPGTGLLPALDDQPNWLGANSLWITIWPQSGAVKVAENRLLNPNNAFSTADSAAYNAIGSGSINWVYTNRNNWQRAILLSRANARGTEGMGGL